LSFYGTRLLFALKAKTCSEKQKIFFEGSANHFTKYSKKSSAPPTKNVSLFCGPLVHLKSLLINTEG
jgi:hypothetical protein